MGEDEPPLSKRESSKAKRFLSTNKKTAQPAAQNRSASLRDFTNHDHTNDPERSSPSQHGTTASESASSPISPPNTADPGQKPSPLEPEEKPPWSKRIKAGSGRFLQHTINAITHSRLNVLLVFVPIGIAMNFAPIPGTTKPTLVFAMNAVAIIPLAGLLTYATESVSNSMGDTWAALLNVTFGNAVELIIFIALAKNEIRIVQASILGSILANLLLILGMAFLFGGLRFQEQLYNNTPTQMHTCLLSLSVSSLLLPTAFHASFADNDLADLRTLKISRGTSVVLLLVYVLYLLFQLKTHAYMFKSTPQKTIDEESHPGVLAELMNSSASDTDSSTSSDSDSSSGSHNTARKRFTRALTRRKRRKSSASSTMTPSSPSVVSSPSVEKRSVLDEFPHGDGYFDHSHSQEAVAVSGDEGDTDGEHENNNGASRVRDFGNEQAESSNSPTKSPEHRSSKHPRKKSKRSKKSKKTKRGDAVEEVEEMEMTDLEKRPEEPPIELERQESRRVGFAEDTLQAPGNGSSPSGARRPFTRRQISRPSFKPPPLPSLLSNTVFSQPPPENPSQPAGFSIAHRTTSRLRRTSSLPDRLNRPISNTRSQSNPNAPAEATTAGTGTLAINEPDAKAKDTSSDDDAKPAMSRTAAVVLLIASTGLVAFCAELLVDAIPAMVAGTTVSQAFIGLIILPIVGNAAEHVTAVTFAAKNKMDLAIGVAVGSSIQIALFVTPFVVLLGWILNKDMSLYFNLFETVSLFVTAFVINFLVLDGRSNYMEGSLLIAAYIIIAVAAFFYPNSGQESELGGSPSRMMMMMG